ncbi:hypothetical protein Mapa_002202 [Marchantia paleacea]|nr:hypothetical protein Mapa_002202 [Marchantia paleacea]
MFRLKSPARNAKCSCLHFHEILSVVSCASTCSHYLPSDNCQGGPIRVFARCCPEPHDRCV